MWSDRFILKLANIILLFQCVRVDAQKRILNKPGCSTTEVIQIDRTVARLLPFGPNGRSMPENVSQLKRFCPESKELTNKIETFLKKCYTQEMFQTGKLALYPATKSVQQFCPKNGNKRVSKRVEKIMKVSPCINKYLNPNDTCANKFIDNLEVITKTIVDDKLKLPYVCCSAVNVLQCIEDMIDRQRCARENKKVILDFMGTSSGDFFNIACGDWNDSTDKCDQLAPLKRSSPNKFTSRYLTPVFLVMDLLGSLGA